MLSEATINEYVKSVPAIPKVVKNCMSALYEEDLTKAADFAFEDKALMNYLKNIVNKPIFGFRSDIKDARQLFGVLGLSRARQLLYSYYVLLLLPKNWEVFDFDSHKFQEFQARLIFHWSKILEKIGEDNKEIASVVTIIPASLIVCEMLFRSMKDTVSLLREKKSMSYESILIKMTGFTLFDISLLIARKWELSQKALHLLQNLSKNEEDSCEKESPLVQYLKLLLFYEMSRPVIIESGLSDMFELEIDFDANITEEFYLIVSEKIDETDS
jgi:HD-like signal output (HDOD) protein